MTNRFPPLLYIAAGAAIYGGCSVLYSLLKNDDGAISIQPSPFRGPASSDKSLSYPASDYIPGARDIATPLGSMRIYEFGPLDAERKVLLVHGISTPCVSLAGIAEGLSEKGCRVMMMDLFGRGWSDAPSCRYDEALYTTQILMALASSPISWTGDENISQGFSIIGYSMGGGIAANFTNYFPYLVNDLVLLAPAGLLRPERATWSTKLLYSGLLPDFLVSKAVKHRLTTSPNVRTTAAPNTPSTSESQQNNDVVSAEVAAAGTSATAFSRPIDAEAVVKWQMSAHPGFIPAFISSYCHAPVRGQHDVWRGIGTRLDAQRAAQSGSFSDPEAVRQGLKTGKVLMVVGKTDAAIHTPELLEDARGVFGGRNMDVLEIEAGHEVPITHAGEIVEWVWKHWEGVE